MENGITNITERLQQELQKINSDVTLLNENNTDFRGNFRDWAWGEMNGRNIQVLSFIDLPERQIQIEEKGIIAAEFASKDITLIARIIDLWLSKRFSIDQIKENGIELSVKDEYLKLINLPVKEILSDRWNQQLNRIKKGNVSFNSDLFVALMEKLNHLFPYFSHDNLWFSNIIHQPNQHFNSPYIFCNGNAFEVKRSLDNKTEIFITTDIQKAVATVIELLPKKYDDTINPLTR